MMRRRNYGVKWAWGRRGHDQSANGFCSVSTLLRAECSLSGETQHWNLRKRWSLEWSGVDPLSGREKGGCGSTDGPIWLRAPAPDDDER